MNKVTVLALILAVGLLSACSPQTPTAAPPSPAPATALPRKSGTIRFSQNGNASVKDVPLFMALDSLRDQGYTINVIVFAKSNLIPPALDKGDVDVASANTTATWAATAQGADIRTVVARVNTSFYLVADKGIDHCRALDGKVIAFSTRQSVGYVMFEQYVARNCAGIKPEIILVSESSDRVVALQAREVAAAYLELEDWLQLQERAPGQFHVLIDFAQEFPNIQQSTFSMRREWAQQHPELVKDFVRALLTANRSVMANRQLLRDGIVKYLSIEAAQAQLLAGPYLAAGIWDANGGTTVENIEYTLQFLRDGGILTADSKVEDVADLSYLNAVLAEIGRQ